MTWKSCSRGRVQAFQKGSSLPVGNFPEDASVNDAKQPSTRTDADRTNDVTPFRGRGARDNESHNAGYSEPEVPEFPQQVVGFSFGMTVEGVENECPNGFEFKRGTLGVCTNPPRAVDFMGRTLPGGVSYEFVLLGFAGGKLVEIWTPVYSREFAVRRITEKYGPPTLQRLREKWIPITSSRTPANVDVAWRLKGGNVTLLGGKGPMVAFVSDMAKYLKKSDY